MGINIMFILYFCCMNLEIIYIKKIEYTLQVLFINLVYIFLSSFKKKIKIQTQCLHF